MLFIAFVLTVILALYLMSAQNVVHDYREQEAIVIAYTGQKRMGKRLFLNVYLLHLLGMVGGLSVLIILGLPLLGLMFISLGQAG